MNVVARIFATGCRDMDSSALVHGLQSHCFKSFLTRPQLDLHLLDHASDRNFLAAEQLDHISISSSKGGCLYVNNQDRAGSLNQSQLKRPRK